MSIEHDTIPGKDRPFKMACGERGADILANVPLGFGVTFSLAIQVKMHWDLDSDMTGLEQLETAFRSHRIQAALLVSMADQLSPQVHDRVEEMQGHGTHRSRRPAEPAAAERDVGQRGETRL